MRIGLKITFFLFLVCCIRGVCWGQQPPRSPIIPAGPANESPWLPDLRDPGQQVRIPVERRIDVLILGDGYTSRSRFEVDVRRWYVDFAKITPWKQTTGIFRVRGYWTPSEAYATPAKRSYYKLPASRAEVGDVYAKDTRQKIWEAVERSEANPALTRDNYLSHTVVVMLIRTSNNYKPSGKCRVIVAPDGKRRVRVAFGNYTHHEFGHAIARLDDEYIGGPNKSTGRKQPKQVSLFSVSNIAHSRDPDRLQWAHLAPGTPLNPDKNSVIGLFWIGGEVEFNAWHSEPFCLMNGGSSNWNRSKTARTGWWRTEERFCFWCEEVIVARLWQRAGLLGMENDGYLLWKRWETDWRPAYQNFFDISARIIKRNASYAKSRLTDTKLYELPKKATPAGAKEADDPDTEDVPDPLEDTPAPNAPDTEG